MYSKRKGDSSAHESSSGRSGTEGVYWLIIERIRLVKTPILGLNIK
jgi:hypothetical protein